MIPKKIHYCWFGNGAKGELIETCIASWRKILPDYEIIEWNESNFDWNKYEYSRNVYNQKKWAFVADYARLIILREHGGIYLDTDMFVLKPFDEFLNNELVLGKEDETHISAGMIACVPGNVFIDKCLEYYNLNTKELITIPRILTKIYNENINILNNVKVFERKYFYPYTADNIKKFNYSNAPTESYAVHMWNYSWGHPAVKLIKKIGIHKIIVKTLDKLKIKNFIKKLLGTA
jgi:mannosyltransferase OCH1-like enzyme